MTRQNISKIIINQKVVGQYHFRPKSGPAISHLLSCRFEGGNLSLVSCNSVMNGLIYFLCLYGILLICMYVHAILYINMRLNKHQDNMSVCFIPPYTHFYIVKLGFYRALHYFLIFALKHTLWVLVRTASLL